MSRQLSVTIAVTGATGFLGRAACASLLAAGHSVLALTRPTTRLDRLPVHERVTPVALPETGDDDAVRALREYAPDALLHLGWSSVSGPERATTDHIRANLAAAVQTVELAAATGCSRWIGLGSQAEYGPSDAVLTETSPLHPATSYGRAKVATWGAARELAHALGMEAAWARVFSVYGPGDHPGTVLSYTINELLHERAPELGPCTQPWDFLFIDDAGDALAALATHSAATGVFNVASGEAQPIRVAIDLASAAIGSSAQPTYAATGPAQPLRATAKRLSAETGWTPHTTLSDGIAQTVHAARLHLPSLRLEARV